MKEYLDTGRVSSILYSNPNNPSWICFTEEELQIIGELAWSLGLTATSAPIRAEELVSSFALTKISRSSFTWDPKG